MTQTPLSGARAVTGVVAAVCLVVAGYLFVHARDESALRTANRQGLRGDLRGAVRTARPIRREPAAADALRVRAYALLQLGDDRGAIAAFERALRLRPSDWTMRRDLAVLFARRGRRMAARRQMGRALALNPRLDLPPGFRRRAAHR